MRTEPFAPPNERGKSDGFLLGDVRRKADSALAGEPVMAVLRAICLHHHDVALVILHRELHAIDAVAGFHLVEQAGGEVREVGGAVEIRAHGFVETAGRMGGLVHPRNITRSRGPDKRRRRSVEKFRRRKLFFEQSPRPWVNLIG
jgi:hypothetical protein